MMPEDALDLPPIQPPSPTGPQTGHHFAVADMERPSRKSHRKSLIIAVVVIAVLIACYLGGSIFFMSHFGFHTVINGQDCSFKTVDQVNQMLESEVDSYQLQIIERDNSTETIDGSSIDLAYVDNTAAQDLLDSQNPWLFLGRISSSTTDTLRSTVSFDESKLNKEIAALDCMDTSDMIAPVNATPTYDGTEYVVADEVLGTTIDTDVIYGAITDSINDVDTSLNLDEASCYVNPTVYSDSQTLLDTVDLYNKYVNFSITYTFGSSTEVLDATTAVGWLVTASDGTVSVDQTAIASWVASLAASHDTVGTTRTFTSQNGSTVSVSGGTYGWQIDQAAEVTDITQAIENNSSETRDPIYTSEAVSHSAPDWGSTYVEVDISDQTVWYVENGAVVLSTSVVTGLADGTRDTPTGVYDIVLKKQDATLRGPLVNGSYEWESQVSYWMQVTWGGVGLHDATWRSSFGGTIYLTDGSHGCINMPYAAAQSLYAVLAVGTPVIIHQ